ncbi:MAG: hypothetical protein ABSC02_07475 [Acidobacteriota bacterium]|jgi:hypothetical protein
MKSICIVFSGLLVLALASTGYSQSLADLAKKEKERRQAVKTDSKTITNEQTAKYRGAAVSTGTPSAPPAGEPQAGKGTAVDQKPAGEAETKAEAAPPDAKPASDEPVDFQGRTESFWKQTMADARQHVTQLENESNVLILKLNDLQNSFFKESDGFKQQEIQREIQKALYEQDQNKENLAKAKSAVTDLEQEARKSGALPGWIK